MRPAYRAEPPVRALGTVIVVHEIFGLTPHIRSVCDRLAREHYSAIAPDLFGDSLGGEALPYSASGKQKGLAIKNAIGEHRLALGLQDHLPAHGNVAVMGFCLGGTLAWANAGHPRVACVIAYYGVGLLKQPVLERHAPTLMHFGRTDASIANTEIEAFRARQPTVEIHEYEAGHAFNRDDDSAFEPTAAELAWSRTLSFLRTHLAVAA